MKKFLITIFIILSACNTPNAKVEMVSSLPVWYSSPKQNDALNLYGIGEGFSMDEANKSALKNLAAKLMVTISSESSMLLEENKFYANEETRQKINEVVQDMTFTNYKVSKTAQMGARIYIEITVDRKGFIDDRTQKLAELNKKMKETYDNLGDKNIIEKYNKLTEIGYSSYEARSIYSVLTGLGASLPGQKSDIELYNSYQKTYENVLDKMELFIESENSPRNIVAVFAKAINQQKIKISKNKNSTNPNLAVLKIFPDIVYGNIYGANIAKLKINISLLSNKNQLIGSNSIEVSGSSVVSKEEALNAAAAALDEKINREGIFKILTIK